MYSTLPVPSHLSPWIRRIIFAHTLNVEGFTTRAKPTGYNYFGAIYRGQIETRYDKNLDVGSAGDVHLSGQIAFEDISLKYLGEVTHLLAEFKPGALYALTGILGKDLAGRVIRPNSVELEQMGTMLPLKAESDLQKCILDFFKLLSALPSSVRITPHYVIKFAEMAERANGLVRVAHGAEKNGVSARTLSGQFRKYVGIRPKLFCRILQLNQALTALMEQDTKTLSDLAAAAGFTDQSHFNKTLNDFFQQAPLEFLRGDQGILPTFLSRK